MAVTVKVPLVPARKVVLFALVIAGGWSTLCDTPAEVLPLKLLSPA